MKKKKIHIEEMVLPITVAYYKEDSDELQYVPCAIFQEVGKKEATAVVGNPTETRD